MNAWPARLLWLLVVLLLVFNIALATGLLALRGALVAELERTEGTLRHLADETLSFQVPISQTIPVQIDIPFSRTIAIPVQTTVVVSETLDLPLVTPLGEIPIQVPLNVTLPIDTVVTVPLSETIAIDTAVPLRMTLPVTVAVDQTPLANYLTDAADQLQGVRSRLEP